MDHLAVGIAAKGAASGSHHNIYHFGAPRQFLVFGGPESRFTESCEYLWDRGFESSTDHSIEINELVPEPGRQSRTSRAFSCTHETNQENTTHTPQCYHPAHVDSWAKPKLFSFFGPSFSKFSILNSQF
jgi:hypothetical protein